VVRKEEATMGNLIADAIKDVTGADFAITNGGGIRADKQYTAGSPLTRKDIFSELPFGNLTTALQLSGKDVLAALENGVSQVEEGAGRFPQVSAGLIVTYDAKKPAGSRLVSVTWNGKPIDPAGSYKVATNDYMLSGGDGYTSFKNGKVLINEREGHLMASDVIDWISKKGSVDVKIEGRIVAAK
jgi:2',3'-cyclic-nucleotide 2'-phosphodiesterase (5'-nucleotidase family)